MTINQISFMYYPRKFYSCKREIQFPRRSAVLALWLVTGVFLSLALGTVQAQVNIFMRIGGQAAPMGQTQTTPKLAGPSTDEQYPGWIQLNSVSHGVSRAISISSGGTSASNPSFSDVSSSKSTDVTTPLLNLLTCGGTVSVTQPIDYVTIDFRNNNFTQTPQTFYRIELQGVSFTGMSTSGWTGGTPSDSFSLTYQKITWSYVSYDATGKASTPITKGWDVSANKAL